MKRILIVILISSLVFITAALTWTRISAQQENPLVERALRRTDWDNITILTEGPLKPKDEAHPLNSFNGLRAYPFDAGYVFTGISDELQFAQYLYRFGDARAAQAQAQRIINSTASQKAQPLAPEVSLETLLAKDDSGTTIRVTDPETGGHYYWYVSTRGRDLSLLMIGGAPHAKTLKQFNKYKSIVRQR